LPLVAAAADWASGALKETTSEGAFGTGANSARISRFRPYETLAKTKMSTQAGIDLSSASEAWPALGVLAFRGPDAARFLQGQLSADVERLIAGSSTLAGLHSPQGRTVAVLALMRTSAEEILAVLPRELTAAVDQRLRKFILRAKVRIEDESDALRVVGLNTDAPAAGPAMKWGDRRVLLLPSTRAGEVPGDATARATWERADVVAGLPQVYTATSEAFVAQMLNLDLLGAIAFDKGCYTGQEVIARAHYRGRVKRRLQRWHAAAGIAPRAGDSARTVEGRALTVVRAAPAPDGGWDLLAVGTFATGADSPETAPTQPGAIVVEGPLPLPYSLPE
jgi:folate-binding protein YgfZ